MALVKTANADGDNEKRYYAGCDNWANWCFDPTALSTQASKLVPRWLNGEEDNVACLFSGWYAYGFPPNVAQIWGVPRKERAQRHFDEFARKLRDQTGEDKNYLCGAAICTGCMRKLGVIW